jgi:hypothetical protein
VKTVRPIFQNKTTNVNVTGVELQLMRIADALESLLEKPQLVPGPGFDADDYSEVVYTNEEEELVQQHLDKRIGGFVVDKPGLY